MRTTVAKAKTVKPLVERLITFAKKGDLSARREAARVIHDHEVLQIDQVSGHRAPRVGPMQDLRKLFAQVIAEMLVEPFAGDLKVVR